MPEFRDDPRCRQVYEFERPDADLSQDRSKVRMPYLVESVGTDGRFVGGLRVFPGMGNLVVHGLKTASASAGTTVNWTLANIVLAKYVAIQKGLSEDVLRGIVMLADNAASSPTGKALYFSYVDSSNGSADVIMLENFGTSGSNLIGETNHRPTFSASSDYDIGFSKRYIYFVASGVTFADGNTYPFNRAYWWDFKQNTWETAASGMQRREAGLFYFNRTYATTDDATRVTTNFFPGGKAKAGDYTFGVRAKSRKHGLRSRMASVLVNAGDGNYYEITAAKAASPVNAGVFDPSAVYADSSLYWGLHHIDAFEIYASPVSPVNSAASQVGASFQLLGELHLVLPLSEKTTLSSTSVVGYVLKTGNPSSFISNLSDLAIAQIQDTFNPFLHAVGEMPRSSRCAWLDGVGYTIADVYAKASPELGFYENNNLADTLRWSSIVTGESENFPFSNVYRPDDPGEKFLGLEGSGDYMFAVTTNSVYRALRNGSSLSVTRLHHKLAVPSRYAFCGVGNSLFVVTASGVKEIDGNTGGLQSLSQIDRVIFDTLQWASTLSSVHIEYDSVAGALILLNTSLDQCVILWEATGAVTRLEDCPYEFLCSGINPKTGLGNRVYFVMTDGRILTIDTLRAMTGYCMCAGASGESVNGTVTPGSTSTSINFGSQVVPENIVGFKVYVTSGALKGESSTVTARGSATNITVSPAFSGAPAATDTIAFAPVVFRAVCPQYTGNGIATDTFYSKVGKTITASFTNITRGEGFNVQVGMYRRTTKLTGYDMPIDENPDDTVQYIGSPNGTQLYPYIECKRADMDFEVQALKVDGIVSGTEAETRNG